MITGNFTDGEKTIYLCDIVGIQFKKSGLLIGYLQFETPSLQMNNKNDNMFSENTFTYENGKNGITNELIEALYQFITDRVEELKYGISIVNELPDFESMKVFKESTYDKTENDSSDIELSEESIEEPTGLKCEICDEHFEHLTYCKIKDKMGTRYRNLCDNCIQKLHATKQ